MMELMQLKLFDDTQEPYLEGGFKGSNLASKMSDTT
jgi:hypothetical protein